jgi:hypothetical protein
LRRDISGLILSRKLWPARKNKCIEGRKYDLASKLNVSS